MQPQVETAVSEASLAAESDRRFQAVWEIAADAMALSDPDGIVLAANPAYHDLYGYARNEVIGKSFAIIFPEDARESAVDNYRLTFQSAETAPAIESVVRCADGSERLVEAHYTFIIHEGRRTAMLSIIRDVTERAQLATAQQELARHRNELLLLVSHDLRSPLTTIKGRAQLVLRRLSRGLSPDQAGIEECMREIDRTATQMKALIDELTETSSREMGRPPELVRQPTDLVELARRIGAAHTSAEHPVSIVNDVDTLIGMYDAERLERVISNLLSNAFKYSPQGGEVFVRVRNGDGDAPPTAIVTVEDSGMGIPPDDLPHIFEHFYRGANVKGLIDGTGVGLAGSKQIVEQHGGTISVQSEEGHGTTITVRLPITDVRQ